MFRGNDMKATNQTCEWGKIVMARQMGQKKNLKVVFFNFLNEEERSKAVTNRVIEFFGAPKEQIVCFKGIRSDIIDVEEGTYFFVKEGN